METKELDNKELDNFVSDLQSKFEKYGTATQGVQTFDHVSQESVYAIAYAMYEKGKYEDSSSLFRILSFLDMESVKYWMGLGASQQMLKNYDEALKAYAFAAFLNEQDPYAHFHAAECFILQENIDQGLVALESAYKVAENKAEHKALVNQIVLMRQLWTERKLL